MKRFKLITTTIAILSLVITFLACEKDTKCVVTVKVVNTSGSAQGNIPVELYADVKTGNPSTTVRADVTASGTTDNGGEVKFTFKLPAIYDIKAIQVVNGQTLVASGIVKLEEGKGVSKEVTLKP